MEMNPRVEQASRRLDAEVGPKGLDRRVWMFTTHSRTVLKQAEAAGWMPGARYTNLRDVRQVTRLGFLDINWKQYDFRKHLAATKATRPLVTVAQDIVRLNSLPRILDQARELALWADHVIVVPKARTLATRIDELIPTDFILGYSVPTKYGGTSISPIHFQRPVHLLGGRPDRQRQLARLMPVVSFDCNRFTLDASFGDYFNGQRFVRHPRGGYLNCIRASLRNITKLWSEYRRPHLPIPYGIAMEAA